VASIVKLIAGVGARSFSEHLGATRVVVQVLGHIIDCIFVAPSALSPD